MITEPFTEPQAQAQEAVAGLRTTTAIRERSGQLLARARSRASEWFEIDDGALDGAAALVVEATRRRYPRLHIPYHSRWRHFEAGGVDRKALLDTLLEGQPAATRARAMIDLAVVSVLLDAGAGAQWKYTEPATGQVLDRSEGLAVASFHAFTAGLFSSDRDHPLQADARGLRAVQEDHLANAFQVNASNPLVGLHGRALLLRRLGEALSEQPEIFGDEGVERPGGLFDLLVTPYGTAPPPTATITAHDILSHLLMSLSGIWPAGNAISGIPLGDCWRHPAARASTESDASGGGLSDGWVPFHKLSQWLTYSLLEPFEWAGVKVRGIEALTGLPEYRNGGLLLDSGVLRLRDENLAAQVWQPGDELIVEWRALTVALLDELAPRVRQRLGVPEDRMPLACVLEGGTWAAGRALAQQRRGGLPPLQVASDGTVF
ncbi:MAG TPA: URC4/urg3 family protein [Ramlibacter sp.]|nr:URC4/urg3 family protein [Ramlibacter sp.]